MTAIEDKIKLQKMYHKVQFAHRRERDLRLFVARSEDKIKIYLI